MGFIRFAVATLLLLAACDASSFTQLVGLGNSSSSCFVDTRGGVSCVGFNSSNQLGDGTTISRTRPVTSTVPGFRGVVVGNSNACASRLDGTVWCWGFNNFGQLGNGGTTNLATPTSIPAHDGATAFALTSTHGCTVIGGAARCWGQNSTGQLGDGSTSTRTLPGAVTGLSSGVVDIEVGSGFSCAILAGGALQCWGANTRGNLGDGSTMQRLTPVPVSTLGSGVLQVALGPTHACALVTGGGVKCWGAGTSGQLGTGGNPTTQATPIDVPSFTSGVRAVGAGNSHTCALRTSGTIACWGNNLNAQLGDGTTAGRNAPVDVLGIDDAIALYVGDFAGCALRENGAIVCWGANIAGALGFDIPNVERFPIGPSGLQQNIASVAVSRGTFTSGHTCALALDGSVLCMGLNANRQLGDGTQFLRTTPVLAMGLPIGIDEIVTGERHTCVSYGGALRCFGVNFLGHLGLGNTNEIFVPTDVASLGTSVLDVAAGTSHTCAVVTGGEVRCWGSGVAGRLGDGFTADRSSPTPVAGLASGAAAVTAGDAHSCALTGGGGVKCWGRNSLGQLGDGGFSPQVLTAVDVVNAASGYAAVVAGANFTCGLTTGGGVRCWGENTAGQLGDGTKTNRAVPTDVVGLSSGVASIAAGEFASCARLVGGGVQCWGNNGRGQLGIGAAVESLIPVAVPLGASALELDVGQSTACAVLAGNRVSCWGANSMGQLGNGRTANFPFALPMITSDVTAGDSGFVLQAATAPAARFGSALAVTDQLIVVGAPSDAGAGAVYIFERGPGELAAKGSGAPAVLSAPAGRIGDKFGAAVAVSTDGNTIVVGSPAGGGGVGDVAVFRRSGSSWTSSNIPESLVTPTPAADIVANKFGASVSLAPNGALVVGAPGSTVGTRPDSGSAYVFDPSGASFVQDVELTSPAATNGGGFGHSVAAAAGRIAIGAPGETRGAVNGAGNAYLVRDSGPSPSQPVAVATSFAPVTGDKFGSSVATDQGLIVVGASGQSTSAGNASGAAVVFDDTGGAPIQVSVLVPDAGAGQGSGESVAIRGGTIAVGAPLSSVTRPSQGRVFVYEVPPAWSATSQPAGIFGSPGNEEDARFGSAVAISNRWLVVGVPLDDAASAIDVGRVDGYITDRTLRSGFE